MTSDCDTVSRVPAARAAPRRAEGGSFHEDTSPSSGGGREGGSEGVSAAQVWTEDRSAKSVGVSSEGRIGWEKIMFSEQKGGKNPDNLK